MTPLFDADVIKYGGSIVPMVNRAKEGLRKTSKGRANPIGAIMYPAHPGHIGRWQLRHLREAIEEEYYQGG